MKSVDEGIHKGRRRDVDDVAVQFSFFILDTWLFFFKNKKKSHFAIQINIYYFTNSFLVEVHPEYLEYESFQVVFVKIHNLDLPDY